MAPSFILCAVSKQKISCLVRFSLWQAHNRVCTYCGEPLTFSETDIDHVIPEALRAEEKRYHDTILSLGLPEDFDISSYSNFYPHIEGAIG
jgi:hypothetical protein